MLAEKKELLKRALLEARLNELETIPSTESLEKEHVFSLAFEKKMKAITNRKKISTIIHKAGKYVAGFAVIGVLTGSAFLVMQGGGLFFDKLQSNDAAIEEIVEDAEKDTLAAEEYEPGEENFGVEDEEQIQQETVATGSTIGGIDADVVTNIYEENGSTVIELNYTDSEVLSQGIAESFITFSEAIIGADGNDSPDYNYNDSLTTDSTHSDIMLDEELYDVVEEDKLVRYVIDSDMIMGSSRLNIYLETASDTVKLSFKVNEADGSLSLIE